MSGNNFELEHRIGISTALPQASLGINMVETVKKLVDEFRPDVIELCPNGHELNDSDFRYLMGLDIEYTVHSPQSYKPAEQTLAQHHHEIANTLFIASEVGAHWMVQHPPITPISDGGLMEWNKEFEYLLQTAELANSYRIPIVFENGVVRQTYEGELTGVETARTPEYLRRYVSSHPNIIGLVFDGSKVGLWRRTIEKKDRSLQNTKDMVDAFRSSPALVKEVHLVGIETWLESELYNRALLASIDTIGAKPLIMIESTLGCLSDTLAIADMAYV